MRHYVRSGCAIAQRSSYCASCGALAVGLFLLTAIPKPAQATPISFAQFSEADPGGIFFRISIMALQAIRNLAPARASAGAAIPVNFTFLSAAGAMPADLTGNQ